MLKQNNKKGSVLIFVILFSIIMAIIAAACFAGFNNFVNFVRLHEEKARAIYLTECGMRKGKWLLDEGISPSFNMPTSGNPYNEDMTVDTTNDVHITITYNNSDDFTITSATTTKTITADYISSKITSWR